MSDKLETSVNLAWTAGNNSTRFGIAAKYQLDKDASVSVSSSGDFDSSWWMEIKNGKLTVQFPSQAKVNNNSLVGVGYTQTLRPGKSFSPAPQNEGMF